MAKSSPENPVTRRSFALGAAAAATAALLPGKPAWAEIEAPEPVQSNPMDKLSPAARAEVDAKVKEIFRKYGKSLSDEQKADVRKVMAETQDGLEKMRAFALANGDQPAAVFKYTDSETTGHVE